MKCAKCQSEVPTELFKELFSFKGQYKCPCCGAKLRIDFPWGYLMDLGGLLVGAIAGMSLAMWWSRDYIPVLIITLVLVTIAYILLATKFRKKAGTIIIDDETDEENTAGCTCPKCGEHISKWAYTKGIGTRAKCSNCHSVLAYDMPVMAVGFLYSIIFLLYLPAFLFLGYFIFDNILLGWISFLGYIIFVFPFGAYWEASFLRKRYSLKIIKEKDKSNK